jgi:hypothetical protein
MAVYTICYKQTWRMEVNDDSTARTRLMIKELDEMREKWRTYTYLNRFVTKLAPKERVHLRDDGPEETGRCGIVGGRLRCS